MTSAFRLYPTEASWWSHTDYAFVLSTVERLKAKNVLEFGPGSSTLALVEGGAIVIDSCEDDPIWAETYCARLERRFPGVVTIRPYEWSDPLTVAGLAGRYDLALIDGPKQTPQRPTVIDYCLQRCKHVLVPTESNEGSRLIREACEALAAKYDLPIEITQTGPLAGAFALIGPKC